MCTVLLPPGVNPIAVNKYIISYHFAVSACMSAHVNPAPTGWICVYVGNFHENLSQNFIVQLKSNRIWDTSLEDISRVCIVDSDVCSFILVKNATCFGQTCCPSSGVLILYSQQLVFVTLVALTVCWRGWDGTR